MRIGFLAPPGFAFGNAHSGAAALARLTVAGATRAGHEAVLLSPWVHMSDQHLDVVHAFAMSGALGRPHDGSTVPWILTPVHDSLKHPLVYRTSVAVGRLPRVFTEAGSKADLLGRVDHLVAMSDDERTRLVGHFRIERSRISVVHCPVPAIAPLPDSEVRTALRDLGVVAGDFALAVCDYGAPRKNIVRLVEAALATGTRLVLAGSASLTRDLASIRTLANGADDVTLLGPVVPHHKVALMQAAAVYCQPSIQEGAGLAAMEAAILGCTVVASDVGGVREHLGPDAVWVNPRRVSSIADGLLVAKEEKSTAVKRFVEGHRSFDSFVDELATVYRAFTPVSG